MPNVLSPRDLVSRPEIMDETVPHTHEYTGIYAFNSSHARGNFARFFVVC